MDRGYSVMVFPEGAVSREGGMKSFRQGIGLLAQEARIPILPVALRGLEEMQKSGWFRSGHLEIRIGDAIPVDEEATPAELTARLEEAVAVSVGEVPKFCAPGLANVIVCPPCGVTLFDGADAGPGPAILAATTVKV